MGDLQALYTESVARFLKTVVCFDDEVYWWVPERRHKSLTGQRPSDGFDEENSYSSNPASYEVDFVEKTDTESAHLLDGQELTNAFAEKGILCSVVDPGRDPKEMENSIARMARAADVVILDWEMPGKNHSVVQNAIVQIVEADNNEGGCLRLIIIYSAANGQIAIDELGKTLESYNFQKSEDGFELKNEHTLIVFLNKPHVIQGTPNLVDYKDLPKRIIDEMLKLTAGLLPSTALRAVSVLREQSHHILAKFPARLDGAYIVHRSLIPDPNDAETFLLDLLSSELSAILYNDYVRLIISGQNCSEWLEINPYLNESQKTILKCAVSEPLKEGLKDKVKQIKHGNHFGGGDSEKISDTLFDNIYGNNGVENAQADMSMLSTLDRHRWNLGIPQELPKLKLGSIVRLNNEYLLCFQPLCQSVRISDTEETLFPFFKLRVVGEGSTENQNDKKKLDICIRDEQKKIVWLTVQPLPKQIVSYGFKAASKEKAYVAAELKGEAYIFRSGEFEFEWCADLKIGKAQRLASALASQIHTLGIDEFEWMRLHQ